MFIALIAFFAHSSMSIPGLNGELHIKNTDTEKIDEASTEPEKNQTDKDNAYATPGNSENKNNTQDTQNKPTKNETENNNEQENTKPIVNDDENTSTETPSAEEPAKPTAPATSTGSRVIDPSKPMVALTFDDGPCKLTDDFLDLMEKYNVVCTFFEVGQNASSYSSALKRELELGCELGNHSYTHASLTSLSEAEAKAEIDKANNAFIKATGQPATLIRPPYGSINTDRAKIFDQPVVTWSVDTLDWKSRDADKVMDVIYDEGDLDGKVILMHSIHESSLAATKRLIPYLLDKGYQLVTVSELYEYKHGEALEDGELYTYKSFR